MLEQQNKKGSFVSVDLENMMYSSADAGQVPEGYDLMEGFTNMFEWIKTFSRILCANIYLPVSQFGSDSLWHKIWKKYKDEFTIAFIHCPRKEPGIREKADDVDAHLIYHSKQIVDILGSQVKYFVLASGDRDYAEMLWGFRRKCIEIAFALGSEKSFSQSYRRTGIVAKNPITGEDLIHYFSPRKD